MTLKHLLQTSFALSFLGLSACSTKAVATFDNEGPKTYLRSQLTIPQLVEETSTFLEYYKGYNLGIKDLQRGLIVTDWVASTFSQRHRVSIRVNRDVDGSLLTAHWELQVLQEGRWYEEPSLGHFEADLIAELDQHLQHRTSAN